MNTDLHPAIGFLMVERLDLDGFLLFCRRCHQARMATHAIACSGYCKWNNGTLLGRNIFMTDLLGAALLLA